MNSFDFVSAPDVASAVRAGSAPAARYVAGGTTLLDLMKLGVEQPTTVIDVTPLARRDTSLARVTELPNGGLRLGALALMSDVAWDPRVGDRYPLVSQSLLLAASGQLRNMATMGGNILQRTRCSYFRDTATPCNKREPGSGCSAIGGFNRTHAILGTSEHCIATHPSDLAVALTALDAVVQVQGAAARSIAFADFHLLPGTHPEHENMLKPGELITSIDIPAVPFAKRSMYLKVRDRASYAFALASAAVALDIESGTIRAARVALGGIGTKPWRSHEAEAALIGKKSGDAAFRGAANAALASARSHKDNQFKVELAKRTLVRALAEVSA
jgi:xanthine dehydrogenase YagS FAD-binding subunit